MTASVTKLHEKTGLAKHATPVEILRKALEKIESEGIKPERMVIIYTNPDTGCIDTFMAGFEDYAQSVGYLAMAMISEAID